MECIPAAHVWHIKRYSEAQEVGDLQNIRSNDSSWHSLMFNGCAMWAVTTELVPLWLLHRNVWEITRCVLVHCYRKMNIIWKLRSCCSHYCKHLIIVQRKTNCILVCNWDMKLGVLPLWSAWKELSSNVLKVIIDDYHIFAKNRTQAKAIIHGFSTHSKIDIIWKLYSCWSQWFKFLISHS